MSQLTHIDENSKAHWNGDSWGDLYLRTESPATLEGRLITRDGIREKFSSTYIYDEEIYTGYSSHREKCRSYISSSETTVFRVQRD